MPQIITRSYSLTTRDNLERQGIHSILAAIFAARGITTRSELDHDLAQLIPPKALKNIEAAARLLADAIAADKKLMIIADYDCDGATACAVGVRALRAFGAKVDYLVPNRFEYGYGLTPEIVRLAAQSKPDVLITVDNGIASIEGVATANQLGLKTLITDHHLPGSTLPQASCIVNPNQPDCEFPSKNLAGVGVMFYTMLQLRAELRTRGKFSEKMEPNLAHLLDLVALGTVADVVKLDRNNRILVNQGLRRIRKRQTQPGIKALFAAAGQDLMRASTFDLGFLIAPRLNAAGRLTDMRLGIECLITDNFSQALNIAQQLDQLNRERRAIESSMQEQAQNLLENIHVNESYTISLFDPSWHQGVIGIVAGRLKDKLHRPVITFARGTAGEIKGSGRSIPGLNLRDALDLVAKRESDLLIRFGGHAAAAGVSLREENFEKFSYVFEEVVQNLLTETDLTRVIETDGRLPTSHMTLDLARLLENQVWGQGFPQPLFCDSFQIENIRVFKDKHTKFKLRKEGKSFNAIQFNSLQTPPLNSQAVYRFNSNEFNGLENVQLMIEHWDSSS